MLDELIVTVGRISSALMNQYILLNKASLNRNMHKASKAMDPAADKNAVVRVYAENPTFSSQDQRHSVSATFSASGDLEKCPYNKSLLLAK